MSRPSPIVSYAQNHEDVVLARIFKPWTCVGHWIDIGAGHPTFDSVTQLFSEFGWTGINVEPLTDEFSLLEAQRPNDINLNCAVGSKVGSATLYVGPPESRGTSTLVPENAVASRGSSSKLDTAIVPIRTLASVVELAPWEVDFIKIDVEGMEADVIASADWRNFPARVVVVEATYPNSTTPSHEPWESILLDAGFTFRLFDGLNRFYSHRDFSSNAENVESSAWYPATVQDSFIAHSFQSLRSELITHTKHLLNQQAQIDEMNEYISSLSSHLEKKTSSLTAAISYAHSLEEAIRAARGALTASESTRVRQQMLIDDLRLSLEALRVRIEQITGES